MSNPAASKESASLADFLQLLRVRRALVLLILAIVVIATLAVTAFLPNWYLATTKVSVQKPEAEMKVFSQQSASYYDPYFIQDQFKIMQSEKILYPVIRNLGLNAKIAAMIGSAAPLTDQLTFRYILDKMLRVESQRSSSIIEINVYAQDAALAAQIANELARVYSEDRISLATSEQREGISELVKQVAEKDAVVKRGSDEVERLRKELNVAGADTGSRVIDMDVQQLQQMAQNLIVLRVDANSKKAQYEAFRNIKPEDRPWVVNAEMIPDQNIQQLLTAYLVSEQNVNKLRASNLGDAHPEVIAAISIRDTTREQLDKLLAGFEKALEQSYRSAEVRVLTLENQMKAAKGEQITSASTVMRPFNESVQRLEQDKKFLDALKYKLEERKIDFQAPKRTIEILNTAEASRRPSKPNWTLNFIFSLFFGSVLGVGVAVMLEYFDMSFRNVADVEARLKLAVLGVIPHNRAGAADVGDDPAATEPYRVLQTNLNLALPPGQPAALVIFSAGPGEGKSTTLLHLARMMALAGEKVLLIDSDLRRPTQHKLAGKPKEPGLTELLQDKATIASVTQRNIAPNLDFIPSGASEGFTLGLLYQNRLRQLIGSFKQDYNKIVFDSPPIIGVSDASVLASVIDGAVLLIQHRRNPASMVLRAQQLLASLKTPMLGAVLNQVPMGSGDDYGYYTSNYSYYGEGRKKRKTEDGGQKAEGGGRRTEGGGDKLDLG